MTTYYAIGLMSGTSADGVSAVLAAFKEKHFEIISHSQTAYPDHLLPLIRLGGKLPASELSQLNMALGEIFAKAALQVLKKSHISPADIHCIGSHGQTIYHGPNDSIKNTLQISDPAVIAERTGIPVVSHFRQKDMAVGGEGAPLIPFFDQYFFSEGPIRAFQNIGGIGNVTIVGKAIKDPLAFDTGPGNALMDLAVRIATNNQESFDKNGEGAKKGKMNAFVVHKMMEDAYFKKPPPKSTGLELFNRDFLNKYIPDEKIKTNLNDVLATLNYLTCISIQESYRRFIFPKFSVSEIIISGGGSHNKTLMKKLECLFAPIPIIPIDKLGIPSQIKEPLAFAFMGLRCLLGKNNHLPHTTGAKKSCVLGSITKP
ncbi:MAG: anhydro-N-acetylmuramic acid kinase [Elusimicrobiota bacterium]